MKKLCFLLTAALAAVMPAPAQKGAITPDMLDGMRKAYQPTPAEKALRNALNATDINTLAADADARNNLDDDFKYKVDVKGVTDQQSSGRCWLFTGLNVLRAQAIRDRSLEWDKPVTDICTAKWQFCQPYAGKISDRVKDAVRFTFDYGIDTLKYPVTHFYASELIPPPDWTYSKEFRGEIDSVRFYY